MIKVSELKKLEVFQGFTDEQIAELSVHMEKMNYLKGEKIYDRGSPAKYLFVVMEGIVSLRLLGAGETEGIAFEHRERGEMFGVATFMQPPEYTLTAVCQQDAEILAIDADELHGVCDRCPDIGYRLMKTVAQIYLDRYKQAKIALYRTTHSAAAPTA